MSNISKDKESKEKIGFWAASSLVVGNMIGSGIFLLPATLAIYGGISVFGWILTTVGVVFLALVFSRLSRIIKNPGGPYSYTKEGFGKFAGFLVAWGYWVSIWCGNAAIAVAGTGYLGAIIPQINGNKPASAIIAICAIWLFSFINTRRIKSIATVQIISTIIKVVPILVMGTIGYLYFNADYFKPMNLSGDSTLKAITGAASLALWAFLGLESATIPSDRVKRPEKTIPMATMAGTIFAAIIFIGSTTAVMGIVDPAVLKTSESPFSEAAGIAWGETASLLFALAAAISCFGALNGWILLQGQIPLAASKDKLFPKFFGKVSKNGAPIYGIVFSSILASLLVTLSFTRGLIGMFKFIITLSTLTVLLPYLLTSLSEIIILKKKGVSIRKMQFQMAVAIGIPAFIYSLWAVIGLDLEVIVWGMVLLAVGVPVYFLTTRRN